MCMHALAENMHSSLDNAALTHDLPNMYPSSPGSIKVQRPAPE